MTKTDFQATCDELEETTKTEDKKVWAESSCMRVRSGRTMAWARALDTTARPRPPTISFSDLTPTNLKGEERRTI